MWVRDIVSITPKVGTKLVLLLCAGDKGSQQADIAWAALLRMDYFSRKEAGND